MNASTQALLDRLTDPTDVALTDLQDAIQELAGEIVSLKVAKDEHGQDDRNYLSSLVRDAEQCLDALTEALGR